MKKKLLFLKNNPQEILHREKVNERLRFAAAHDVNTVLKYLGTVWRYCCDAWTKRISVHAYLQSFY